MVKTRWKSEVQASPLHFMGAEGTGYCTVICVKWENGWLRVYCKVL